MQYSDNSIKTRQQFDEMLQVRGLTQRSLAKLMEVYRPDINKFAQSLPGADLNKEVTDFLMAQPIVNPSSRPQVA